MTVVVTIGGSLSTGKIKVIAGNGTSVVVEVIVGVEEGVNVSTGVLVSPTLVEVVVALGVEVTVGVVDCAACIG
ncbi:MAG TPA: hypothetical protein VIJ25_00795 [Methylococcales bacterium]